MRNTGTIYSSTERTPTVLPEMAAFSFVDLLEAKRWALDTRKGRRNLDKWELGKIALRLKPDIEARVRENMGTRTDLSATLPKGSDPMDARRELADAVGLGERTMGKIMQIEEHAPAAVKEALDSGDLSIHQGYNITQQVRELPEEQWEEAAALAVELEKAKKEIRQADAESDRRHKIAGVFCKAFERAVLLTPSEEDVRIWTQCTRMTPEEIQDSAKEARELAGVFASIAGILETLLPGGCPRWATDQNCPGHYGDRIPAYLGSLCRLVCQRAHRKQASVRQRPV